MNLASSDEISTDLNDGTELVEMSTESVIKVEAEECKDDDVTDIKKEISNDTEA